MCQAAELHSRYFAECKANQFIVRLSFRKGGTHMDNKEYNEDVYLEPTVELSSDAAAAVGSAQNVDVIICVSGC